MTIHFFYLLKVQAWSTRRSRMDAVQTLASSVCREQFPSDELFRRSKEERVRPSVLLIAKGHRAERAAVNFDSDLFRRINKTKSDQGRVEVLVQLADETVAATGFARERVRLFAPDSSQRSCAVVWIQTRP